MKTLLLYLFIFICTSVLFPQEKQDSIKVPEVNHYFQLREQLNEIDFLMELKSIEREAIFQEQNGSIWLWTYQSLKQNNSGSSESPMPEHISLPLYRQYLKDSKFNPIKAILGAAEAGAVGYLAYKSISKYGLFP